MREESDFHLHISTGWQILRSEQVIMSDDTEGLYGDDGWPKAKSIEVLDTLIGCNRFVEGVFIANTGNIDFNLTGNVSIHILRNSKDGEEWRLWATNRGDQHFVVEIPDEGTRKDLVTITGDFHN